MSVYYYYYFQNVFICSKKSKKLFIVRNFYTAPKYLSYNYFYAFTRAVAAFH